MTSSEVLEQLDRYETLSRASGAIGTELLRPGLTFTEIQRCENKHGVRLSEDARAVWSWRNGAVGEVGTPKIRFWSDSQFLDLDAAISYAKMILEIQNGGDTDLCLGATWVTLAQSSVSRVIDITDADLVDSPVLLSAPDASPDEFPIVSVAKQIWWWNWSIENDIRYVGEGRQWFLNFDNFPTGPERHLL